MDKKERKTTKQILHRLVSGLNKTELDLLKDVLAEEFKRRGERLFGF